MLDLRSHLVGLNLMGREQAAAPGDALADERREAARHITIWRVALLHTQEAKELCLVRNISAGGLSARVYRPFTMSDAVEVEFRSDQRLRGSVKWVRDYEIGLAFEDPIDVEAVLTSRWATEDGRRQRLPRIDLQCHCQLRVGGRFYLATLVASRKAAPSSTFVGHSNAWLTLS